MSISTFLIYNYSESYLLAKIIASSLKSKSIRIVIILSLTYGLLIVAT